MTSLKNLLSAALTALLLSACAKQEPGPGRAGCAETLTVPVSAHRLGAAEVQAANGLFARNNIASRNFRYTRYMRGALQTQYPLYTTFDEQLVVVEEYTNGRRIFTGHLNFLFRNGQFHHLAGHPTSGTSLGTTPALTARQLRERFVATTEEFDAGRSKQVREQCVSAEFGYYNLNAGTSNAAEKLVKAWRVSPKNQDYPVAYYQDEAGQLISYDNGIRSFR